MDKTLAEAAAAETAAAERKAETIEEVLSRHRKEKSKLQDKETSLKKAAAKGSKVEQKAKKKRVEEEISRLSAELEAKHEAELASFGYKSAGSSEKRNIDTLVKAIAGVSVSSNADSTKPSKGARWREKKAKEEAAREQRIQEEQSNLVSNRVVENEKLERKLEPLGLTIHEIKPDGHCLYRAVENQLSLHSNGTIQYNYQELRQTTAKYMREHSADFLPFFPSEGKVESGPDPLESFERYCEEIESTAAWGGQLELGALIHCLKKHIVVYSGSFPDVEMGKEYKLESGGGTYDPSIRLSYHRHAYGLDRSELQTRCMYSRTQAHVMYVRPVRRTTAREISNRYHIPMVPVQLSVLPDCPLQTYNLVYSHGGMNWTTLPIPSLVSWVGAASQASVTVRKHDNRREMLSARC